MALKAGKSETEGDFIHYNSRKPKMEFTFFFRKIRVSMKSFFSTTTKIPNFPFPIFREKSCLKHNILKPGVKIPTFTFK